LHDANLSVGYLHCAIQSKGISRGMTARHAFSHSIKSAHLPVIKRLRPRTQPAFETPARLTLAFLTISPFWRHAGVGAIDLAYALIHWRGAGMGPGKHVRMSAGFGIPNAETARPSSHGDSIPFGILSGAFHVDRQRSA
jgi:hypothetical protein